MFGGFDHGPAGNSMKIRVPTNKKTPLNHRLLDVPEPAVVVEWCLVFIREIFRVSVTGIVKESTYSSRQGLGIKVSGLVLLCEFIPQLSFQDEHTLFRLTLCHVAGEDADRVPLLDTSRCKNPQT